MSKPKIICLMGPTAAGKTDVGVELVQQLPMEIISVDSAMIYRQMDIGTAKPEPEILEKAPHRLINILDPTERYSVAQFCEDAHQEIKSIHKNGNTPLLLGGTMMYFRAIRDGLADLPHADESVRNKILMQAEDEGWEAMHEKLAKVDPESYYRINKNDPQRIQRALEVYEVTGKPLSHHIALQDYQSPYDALFIALLPSDRAILHDRIEQRFDLMLENGFIDEVKQLRAIDELSLEHPSMRCVGYRQMWEFLDGNYDQETMRHKGIVATRQLAKRQLTWCRSWPLLHVVDSLHADAYELVASKVQAFLGEGATA